MTRFAFKLLVALNASCESDSNLLIVLYMFYYNHKEVKRLSTKSWGKQSGSMRGRRTARRLLSNDIGE